MHNEYVCSEKSVTFGSLIDTTWLYTFHGSISHVVDTSYRPYRSRDPKNIKSSETIGW